MRPIDCGIEYDLGSCMHEGYRIRPTTLTETGITKSIKKTPKRKTKGPYTEETVDSYVLDRRNIYAGFPVFVVS